jgi:Fe-S-cluster containining protein
MNLPRLGVKDIGSSIFSRLDPLVWKELHKNLLEIYSGLHGEQKSLSVSCDGCGDCCHFVSWGHQMWLTEVELMVLVAEHGLRRPVSEGVCPYLEGAHCLARRGRPLGCRVFFCRGDPLVLQDLFEFHFQKILKLIRHYHLEAHYFELLEILSLKAEESRVQPSDDWV